MWDTVRIGDDRLHLGRFNEFVLMDAPNGHSGLHIVHTLILPKEHAGKRLPFYWAEAEHSGNPNKVVNSLLTGEIR